MRQPALSVLIPCYNEAAIIEGTVSRVLAVLSRHTDRPQLVLINDGSTDGTWDIIRALAATHNNIVDAGHEENRGAGYAFRRGLDVATGDYVIHMDADLAMDPDEFCREGIRHLLHNDVVIASRYLGTRADYPLRRRLPSILYRLVYRILLGLPIHDAMSGFFALRASVAKGVGQLQMDGFEVYLELFLKANQRGFRIKEFPLRFTHQTESGELSVLAYAPKQVINTLKIWKRYRFGSN